MHANVPVKAVPYTRQNRLRRAWRKIVRVMACIVVFCTTYAMILPAITKENQLHCGLEEHTHQERCYSMASVQSLICPITDSHSHSESCYEIIPAHTHTEECYSTRQGERICALPEEPGHVHADECYGQVLTCSMAENHTHTDGCWKETKACTESVTSGHIHGPACMQTVRTLTCALPEGHTHGEGCFARQCICQLPETEGHTHGSECYAWEQVLSCGLTQQEERRLICTEQTAEAHVHGAECYRRDFTGEKQLACGVREHIHDLSCRSDPNADLENAAIWEKSMKTAKRTGVWSQDVVAIARTQLGYRESSLNYRVLSDGLTMRGYTRYGAWYGDPYGDWCAMFASFCLKYAGVQMPLESNVDQWIAKLSVPEVDLYRAQGSHVPEPGQLIFFDWDGDGSCNHVGIVDSFVYAEDGSGATIRTIEGNTANQVRSKTYSMGNSTILGYGMLPEQSADTGIDQSAVNAVIAKIDALPSYAELEAELIAYEDAGDMAGYEKRFAQVGQEGLQVRNAYNALSLSEQKLVTNLDKLMELEPIWSVATLAERSTVAALTAYARDTINCTNSSKQIRPIIVYGWPLNHFKENATDTVTLWMAININENFTGRLYVDYISGHAPLGNFMGWTPQYEDKDGDGICEGFSLLIPVDYANSKNIGLVKQGDMVEVKVNQSNTNSDPNFTEYYHRSQYHTGSGLWDIYFYTATKEEKNVSDELTIIPGADTKELIQVNLFDYNSAINTMYNANKHYLGFQQDYGTKSIGSSFSSLSFNFGNNITTDLDAGHTDIASENATGVANRITKFGDSKLADVPIPDAVERLLNGRYPVLAGFGASTNIYFHAGQGKDKGVVQMNTDNINGLFLYNEETGAYTFDSRENHAQFDAATNSFVLYDQLFSPNFIMYPFGNFMPLNDIVHDTVRSDLSDRGYILEIANSAQWKAENGYRSEYATLAGVLNKYVGMMDSMYGMREWTAGNMVQQYFDKAYPTDPNETPKNLNALLPQIYTLDYDTPSNFYFGMSMRMNFMQPKDGMTGKDNAHPMVFEFAGDDDVWVFIDGVRFLDLGGIHRHVGGTIDFVNGRVHYYAFDSYVDGKIKTEPYKTETFAQILQAAGKSTDVLNSDGTFKDYSTHSFDFFYTERGSGSSVCRINFNFPLLKQNAISVAKELTSTTSVKMLGDPDFAFQILKEGTTEPYIVEGTDYTIYDTTTNLPIDTGTVGQYGYFTLKAGQRAEFTGIDENAGKYYVRESLDKNFVDQYDRFYVDGTVILNENLPSTGGGAFRGVASPVKDISDGTTVVAYNNHVDASKLSYLTITKDVVGVQLGYNIYFDMHVELDGEPIPVGTEYDIYTFNDFYHYIQTGVLPDPFGTYHVETEGIISLPDGVIAWIPNLLPGTTFKIWEDSNSATGYVVDYEELWGTDYIEIYDNRAEGTVPIYDTNNMSQAHVCVRVNNRVSALNVPFTVYKMIPNATSDPGNAHTVTIKAKCVLAKDNSGNGSDVTSLLGTEHTQTVTIQNNNGWNPAQFSLSFSDSQFPNRTPVKLMYEITELPSGTGEYTHDSTKFYVTFYLYWNNGKLMLYQNNVTYTDANGNSLANIGYTNNLLGTVTLKKVVNGGSIDQAKKFNFGFSIGKSASEPLQNQKIEFYVNGGYYTTGYTDKDGYIAVNGVAPGAVVELRGLPVGAVWQFEELTKDGFDVTWTKNGTAVSGSMVNGSIPAGGMEVVCTNTSTYVLPETGGGSISYTMAGWMLMAFSAAYLLYTHRKRRREAA